MKKRTKIINWVVIFSLLLAFTFSMSFGLFRSSTKVALAQTIEQNGAGSNHFVEMVAGGIANNSQNNGQQHVICEVSQSQFDTLQTMYNNVHKWDFDVHGHPVSVVTIYSSNTSQQIIKNYLNSSGNQNPNCFVPKVWNIYFLIFNASLS